MSYQLKIKEKTLAEETRIIRKEERKAVDSFVNAQNVGKTKAAFKHLSKFNDLYDHRVNVVRKEARATHLARAYIKGLPYAAVEKVGSMDSYEIGYYAGRIFNMVSKYDSKKADRDTIFNWLNA